LRGQRLVELRLAALGWLDLRAGAGVGDLWRRDDIGPPGPFFSQALDFGLTLRPNRHGLRLRQLALTARYRWTWSQESGLTAIECDVGICGTAPYRRDIRLRQWSAGLSYGFGP